MKDYSRFSSTPVKGGVRSSNSSTSSSNYNFNSRQQHIPLQVVTPPAVPLNADVIKPTTITTNEESSTTSSSSPRHHHLRPLVLTKSSPSAGEESTSTCATSLMNENHPDSEVNPSDSEANQPQSRLPPASVVIDTSQMTTSTSSPSHQQKGISPTNGRANTTSTTATTTTLTASDALSVRKDGVEATISKLRNALDDASSRDATSKTALAKSDAVILELRSSLRQLKRQLDKVQNEKTEAQAKLQQAYRDLAQSQQQARQDMTMAGRQHQLELQQLQQQLVELSNAHNKEERVGELQVQLDRAHAQILTADMVRKELEDTLEAEQYTWELRVQDQERTIQSLQQDCNSLAEELHKCQAQFKEQEQYWNQQVQELQERLQQQQEHYGNGTLYNDNNNNNDNVAAATAMKEKIAELEQERAELQSCLDEALQELEAVDAEMQGNWQGEREQLLEENHRLQRQLAEQSADALEPLQHLYRWLLERDGMDDQLLPNDVRELMNRIKGHLDQPYDQQNDNHNNPINTRSLSQSQQQNDNNNNNNEVNQQLDSAMDQVRDLEAQLSVYRGDLRAREESSAELRASLKEAVALLKPLQDAVAKSEREKQELQQYIRHLKENPSDEEFAASEEHMKRIKDELAAKTKEAQRLQHQVHSLEVQLAETKEISAAKSVLGRPSPPPSPLLATTPNTSATSRSVQTPHEEVYEKQRQESSPPLSKAREEVRAKRAAESALKQLLKDAQERFSTLHRQNIEVEEKNRELQNRLHEAADMLTTTSKPSTPLGEDSERSRNIFDDKTQELQHQLQQMEQILQEKAQELALAKEELERARSVAPVLVNDFRQMEAELQEVHAVKDRLQQVEAELETTRKDLHAKKEAERMLNKSLRDALGLLKPLQLHLEDAEQEKRELIKELKAYRRQLMRLERGDNNETTSFKSRSVGLPDEVNFEVVRAKEQLEATVRQLEQENSQLHDAIEELSHNLNVSGVSATSRKQEERLLEELVELNSRYEVTQSKLKDAHIENHALLDALKLRESTEHDLKQEMAQLKQKLKKSESELDNAKQIATSALIKVEELTMRRDSPRQQQQQQQSPELVPLQVGGTRKERRVKL